MLPQAQEQPNALHLGAQAQHEAARVVVQRRRLHAMHHPLAHLPQEALQALGSIAHAVFPFGRP